MAGRYDSKGRDDVEKLEIVIQMRERAHTMEEIARAVGYSPFRVSVLLWSHRMDLVHMNVERVRGTCRGGPSWGKGGLTDSEGGC